MTDGPPIVLDYRGLRCPLPVLRARRALRRVACGREALITADDSSAPADFTAFCDVAGHELLGIAEKGGVFEIRLRIGRQSRSQEGRSHGQR